MKMKAVKKFLMKSCSSLAALALLISAGTVNQACFWWFHQPKVPEGFSKYTKED